MPKSPASSIALSARVALCQRRFCPIASTTPAAAHASTAACALARVSVKGFSQKTCLPAAAAAITCSAWVECGVVRMTASIVSSASTAS